MIQRIGAVYLIAGAAVAGALWWASRKGNAEAVGTAVGGAAVDMVNGVVSGTVNTIGEGVGIPRTNLTECEKAKAEGRTWDASFACPAGDFLIYIVK
jgi:hypothetical protein